LASTLDQVRRARQNSCGYLMVHRRSCSPLRNMRKRTSAWMAGEMTGRRSA